ncbi:MAG: hypothetical protein MSC31_03845 [Solirubrobacteraceae bacterium MAG38_C4-C5]|nr:hypothetical protein [Candidatus Siliceabacter maunaloa]
MRLLLHDPDDASAAWVLEGLRARGVALEPVGSGELLRARTWHHAVGTDGASAGIVLADGRTIDSREVVGTLNRLTAVPPLSGPVAADDREYAAQELHALWLSWLAALPGPVLNRPTPYSLCGLWLDGAQWALRAGRAGLPCAPLALGDAAQVPYPALEERAQAPSAWLVVACGTVFGTPEAEPLATGCTALAHDVGAELLGVGLARGPDGDLSFATATTLPDLRFAGAPLLDLLARRLA